MEQENQATQENQSQETPEQVEAKVANVLADTDEPIEPSTEEPSQENAEEPSKGPGDEFTDSPTEEKPEVKTGEPVKEPETSVETPKYNPAWDILKKKLSTEQAQYDLPEAILKGQKEDGTPITPDEEFDILVDHIARNIEIEESDPFIAQYKAEKQNENFNFDEFVKNYKASTDIMSLPSKDFMKEYFKLQSDQQKKDWTEDDIDQFLEGKNKIELDMMASDAKKQMDAMLVAQGKEKATQTSAARSENFKKTITDYNTKISARTDKLAEEMMSQKQIGGIPHGQTDIDEFLPFFKEQVSLDPSTGKPKVTELFQDDKVLYEALYLLHKAKKGAFTDFKESYKQEILDKTALNKRQEGGTPKSVRVPSSEDFVS